ncbi:hypothetical protein EIP91_003680 [Steccherinum ochraceum]|uniref:Uncharacterized protein n=1 Tax=Steccherinum ochraceum TaxID=92696 RepID=A0A4R0RQN5_9APHY|nr:hypothetical protein EIP91_003680 [Steccherinum ochraceum]
MSSKRKSDQDPDLDALQDEKSQLLLSLPRRKHKKKKSRKVAKLDVPQLKVNVTECDDLREEDFKVKVHPLDLEYAAIEPVVGRVRTADERRATEKKLREFCEGDPHSSWHDIIPRWYNFCVGVQVEAERQYEVLLAVLALRVSGDDGAALAMLHHERQNMLENTMHTGKIQPVPHFFPDDLEDSDDEHGNDNDRSGQLDEDVAAVEKRAFLKMTVSSKTKQLFGNLLRTNTAWWLPLTTGWSISIMKCFFQNTTYVAEDHLAVVEALRAMRGVPATIAKTHEWRYAVKCGSLARAFEEVTSPAAHLAVQPHSLTGYRLNAWTTSLAAVWHNWTDYKHMKTVRKIRTWVDGTERKLINMQEFIAALCQFPGIIPTACNPLSVLFMTTLDAFLTAWRTWLRQSLVECDVPHVEDWDPEGIYRHLMSVSDETEASEDPEANDTSAGSNDSGNSHPVRNAEEAAPSVERKNKPPPLFFDVGWKNIPLPLQTIIFQSWCFANMKLDQSRYAHRPKALGKERKPMRDMPFKDQELGRCPHCRHLSADEQCIQELKVRKRSAAEMAELDGAVITSAKGDERLPPKGMHGARGNTKYKSPRELKMHIIKPKQAIIDRCKRQIVRLIDADSGEHVGGVVYNMFHPETLADMQKSHANASTGPSIKRGVSLRAWQYGDMYGWGFRQPQGGRPGEGYATYASTKADNIQDMINIFEVCNDAECMLQTLCACDARAFRKIREVTRQAHLNRMGTGGTTSYYCVNYMSCQHRDTETAMSLSCQLGLDTDYAEEFDFAYSEYGVIFRTVVNCGWWFDASKMHGSVIPYMSTVQKDKKRAMSTGIHITIRKKDMDRAAFLGEVLDLHETRRALWRDRM